MIPIFSVAMVVLPSFAQAAHNLALMSLMMKLEALTLRMTLFYQGVQSTHFYIHYSWVYYPKIVADGNFKLEHVIPKCPEQDVYLSDGCMFVTNESAYQNHLATATEETQVCKIYMKLAIS